jgi:DNA-binding GntR family transcriptional regulator
VHRLASGQGRLPLVVGEHSDILDALDAADGERAAARLDFHLERAPTIMESLIAVHEKYFVD